MAKHKTKTNKTRKGTHLMIVSFHPSSMASVHHQQYLTQKHAPRALATQKQNEKCRTQIISTEQRHFQQQTARHYLEREVFATGTRPKRSGNSMDNRI
jgi:hypothetical protein